VDFFDADRLAGEEGAEVNLSVTETDPPAIGDDHDLVVKGIVDIGQSAIGAGGGLLDLGRTLHAEGLVRALVIEDLDKSHRTWLLLEEVGSGRLGGFLLQGQMHPLMAADLGQQLANGRA
jgi:hypothetical protein